MRSPLVHTLIGDETYRIGRWEFDLPSPGSPWLAINPIKTYGWSLPSFEVGAESFFSRVHCMPTGSYLLFLGDIDVPALLQWLEYAVEEGMLSTSTDAWAAQESLTAFRS